MTLDELPHRSRAVVVSVEGTGPDRRRVMDLGLLPGVEVTAQLHSPFGDPTAYLVRGCLIALRRSQARHIQVRAT
ncbi:ferrous iron transport protein A [Cryptosporangium sp. NPDC051539]|uniref:ferrous iron transport protein A n=1 Tax=Cryptosporangium sp. NPDC051539 TaxID=3363962 RepID=UPI0037923D11